MGFPLFLAPAWHGRFHRASSAILAKTWRNGTPCPKISLEMPFVERGPLAGNYAPDYDGRSTVNLLSSLVRARGGRSPHAELEGLPSSELASADTILYLVLDGLGSHQLRRHLARGRGRAFFAQHPFRDISTVFPATTAAAVTTFDTGASPTEHGILSWYLHLPDLGCVSTVLRTTTRIGTPLVPDDFDLQAYYQVPSYVKTVTAHRGLLSFGDIPNVPFGRVGTTWDDRHSYNDLAGLVETTTKFARAEGNRFAYVYWPRYDGLCHELGCLHEDIDTHFDEIDAALAELTRQLRGTNTILCVLADHGLIDVERPRCIDLAEIPGLMDCLAVAPAGDQRQLSCFVRPARVQEFLSIVERELGEACVCVPGEELIDAGVFGPGVPHPALRQRLGDYVLLCNDGYALIHTPPGFEPMYMPGSHGGMSAPEIQIPLYTIRCE